MLKTNNKQRLLFLCSRLKNASDLHAHAVAVSVCGLSMAVLFAVFASTFHAATLQQRSEQHITGWHEVSLLPAPPPPEVPERIPEPLPEPKIVEKSPTIVVPAKPVSTASVLAPATVKTTKAPVRISEESSSSEASNTHAAAPKTEDTVVTEIGSSASSEQGEEKNEDFPAFDHTSYPVGTVPNWGAMRTPEEWNRSYVEMSASDFVSIPPYNLSTLTIPMESLLRPLRDENIPTITAKLFYSTRYLGIYDLDAGERTGNHAGVDLKLARGTPIGVVGGGRVVSVTTTQTLGLHVIIEHRMKNGDTYYSIYGHFDSATVSAGQDVKPGHTIGYVGMTGNTTAPHLHLEIDRGEPGEDHIPYPEAGGTAGNGMVNPITFIARYRNGE